MSLILKNVVCIPGHASMALRCVDVRLVPGEVLGITGPGGSGKSRLLDVLAGVSPIDGGEIACLGEKAPRVLYQPVHPLLPGGTRAPDFFRRLGLGRAATDRILSRFGFRETLLRIDLDLLPARARRMLWLTAVLAREADVYLFDEPTLGLDPGLVDIVAGLLRDCAGNGAAVAVATIDLRFLELMAHRYLFLDDGRVLLEGKPETLLQTIDDGDSERTLQALWRHYYDQPRAL